MREFMQYVRNAFYSATGWNEDNSYKDLNVTAREVIDFPLPRGIRLSLSSLATPHFATSYQLCNVGVVDGSISYLHSSVPLTAVPAQSDKIPLGALMRSYRGLHQLGSRGGAQWSWETGPQAGTTPQIPAVADVGSIPNKDKSSLLYGRLYLPQSLLEAMVIKRFSSALQVQISAVSEQSLRNGGTMLSVVQYDRGKYGVEGLYSTDGGLLGLRGLYNFGGDASVTANSHNGSGGPESAEKERIYGRFSAGGEMYYGTLNKSGGMSLGARFATLPTHKGTPLTATLTINPLMGNINTTYAVLAKDFLAMATRMEFNAYSYESDWAVGLELWSNRRPAGFLLGADPNLHLEPDEPEPPKKKERSFQAKMEWRLDDPEPEPANVAEQAEGKKEEYLGVFKARLNSNLNLGLVWEGRVKSLIFSLGTGVDLHKLGEPFRSLGLEVQYSS
ncbi:mitochondrial distribution and morphology protein 10 [Apiosordaria backusii]|uniref:Mitochondrial distribution and morphology protein 10 n=1 Tax=Apiosordaria backusii TaxID=314023 RepID=A0AA40AIF3_9PEZI|nr:mitochondrial distribution and morphology protein 10 [Apiosordaria backusii]